MNDTVDLSSDNSPLNTLTLAAGLLSASMSTSSVHRRELPTLIGNVQSALDQLGKAPQAAPALEELEPAVPIKKSITGDCIISLENGQKFKSLKRHLMNSYGLTPDQYRERWGTPKDCPTVAPGHAESRSEMARSSGSGRRARPAEMVEKLAELVTPAPEPETAAPATEPEAMPAPNRRGRKPKAIATA
ncbi:MAG: MucR family transcriptional regulator [Parafilimonas terrae]|nr:MucR family transcriptional regulator [Parafilimonas terrae]